jgi:hypothetical protein
MKKIPRRRTTDTSFLNEISTDYFGKRYFKTVDLSYLCQYNSLNSIAVQFCMDKNSSFNFDHAVQF